MENINDFDPSYLLNKVFIVKRRGERKASQGGESVLITTIEIAKSIDQLITNDDQRHNIESIEQSHMPVIYHRDKESAFLVLEP